MTSQWINLNILHASPSTYGKVSAHGFHRYILKLSKKHFYQELHPRFEELTSCEGNWKLLGGSSKLLYPRTTLPAPTSGCHSCSIHTFIMVSPPVK